MLASWSFLVSVRYWEFGPEHFENDSTVLFMDERNLPAIRRRKCEYCGTVIPLSAAASARS